jgi:phosphoribosylaminoimidazole-succinocarboxamide synthase
MSVEEPKAVSRTDLHFPGQTALYHGKVRDVYTIGGLLVMVATDRISAFDHILPKAIPYKGQVLTQIATHFLEATRDICPNWLLATPDPSVAVGHRCEPFPIEMVVRGYLTGHAWRVYKSGERILCGVPLPEGMKEHDKFPSPIITPATKEEDGHDEDISKEEIVAKGIASAADYALLEKYALALFERGTKMAAGRGLILVDTKYEFGKKDGVIHLIDEIHTPDSSRYFYLDGYAGRQQKGEPQKQLSKEFVREWLMAHGFQGLGNQLMPVMPDVFVREVSERYIELYEKITGQTFERTDTSSLLRRIEKNVLGYIESRK